MSWQNRLRESFPAEVDFPEALGALCDWAEAFGQPFSAGFELIEMDLGDLFGPETCRVAVFGKDYDESVYLLWQPEGQPQKVVYLAADGDMQQPILADSFVDFLRLLAVGYQMVGLQDLSQPPPECCAHPDFVGWVKTTFSVDVPSTGEGIASPGDDSFDQWCMANTKDDSAESDEEEQPASPEELLAMLMGDILAGDEDDEDEDEDEDEGEDEGQDEGQARRPGIYVMRLLFQEEQPMPEQEAVLGKLQDKFGAAEAVADTEDMRIFALPGHVVSYTDREVPSQLMLAECQAVEEPLGDELARFQLMNSYPDELELMDSCPWQVPAMDFLAGGHHPHERADILADWLEVLMEVFPQCVAVYFDASGKVLSRQQILDFPGKGPLRLLQGGLMTRYLRDSSNLDAVLVDTLGLHALGLPDVQYYFHTLDPNDIRQHAMNLAIYQFENLAPIEDGHTVEGLEPGSKWNCEYFVSMVGPERDVLDVTAGEFAVEAE